MSRGNTVTNESVVETFLHGGAAAGNKLASIPLSEAGEAVLVGYGHAVYAYRHDSGTVTRYNGWYGHSQTTSAHLNLLDGNVDQERDAKAETKEVLSFQWP